MARRMGFSVIGLPHYTIWHLYEPSVDDLKHMEEMEQERQQREKEDQEEAKQVERAQALFRDPKSQWEADGAAVHNSMMKEKKASGNAEAQKSPHAEAPVAKWVDATHRHKQGKQ